MKSILIVGPTFFGYRGIIANDLSKKGFKVKCINDRPSEKVWFKSLHRLNHKILRPYINQYASKVSTLIERGNFDIVLFLGGMSFCFSRAEMERIKKKSDALLYAYLWDALPNCQSMPNSLELFDRVYSFDPLDCSNYQLTLRPLFYTDVYSNTQSFPSNTFEYDACFIGSVHQVEKLEAILEIVKKFEDSGLKVFTHFYLPSKSVELFRKLTKKIYRTVAFSNKKLSPKEIASIYARSKIIIDSPQNNQVGLTARTIEALGAQRKLITTNKDVKHYDFYKSGNILIWDSEIGLDEEFIRSDIATLPQDIYLGYSIEQFTQDIIGKPDNMKEYRHAS